MSASRSSADTGAGAGLAPATVNILAFHGGGYLGYFSALMAERLDTLRNKQRTGGTLSDSFEMLAGTSAGSIIAAGLAADVVPTEIVRVMRENGETIFPSRRYLRKLPGIVRSRFASGPLEDVLKQVLGDACLGDIRRALLIPTFNQTAGKPCIFRTFDPAQAKIRLVDAVLASAAAPTYFPRHRIGSDYYADGGLVANGPALLAARDMARLFGVPIHHQRIVSIGTTRFPANPGGSRATWGVLGWLFPEPHLLDILMGGQVDVQNELLEALDPLDRIHLEHHLAAKDADRVHLVLADAQARTTLEMAAESCAASISADERERLEIILQKKAAQFVYQTLPGGGRHAALVVARDASS